MRRPLLLALPLLALSVPALAQQVSETVGSRALGMGGAFVGVADDAAATYWNPAGLATGSPAGYTLDFTHLHIGDPNVEPTAGASRRTSKFTSFGTMPFGVALLGTTESYLVAAPGGEVRAETFRTRQYSLSLLQTVVPGLVVGGTLKYVRGTVVGGPAVGRTVDAAFDNVEAVTGHTTAEFDMDISAMVDAHYLRVGLTIKNVMQPTFSDGAGTAMTLQRLPRVGLAVLPKAGLTLAMDYDLDTVDLRGGPRRMLAFGGEQRIGRRIVARAGARWNKAGPTGPAGAIGGSVMVRQHMWIDMHYTDGGVRADRGWGTALRAGF